jgi:hypothetical protein
VAPSGSGGFGRSFQFQHLAALIAGPGCFPRRVVYTQPEPTEPSFGADLVSKSRIGFTHRNRFTPELQHFVRSTLRSASASRHLHFPELPAGICGSVGFIDGSGESSRRVFYEVRPGEERVQNVACFFVDARPAAGFANGVELVAFIYYGFECVLDGRFVARYG